MKNNNLIKEVIRLQKGIISITLVIIFTYGLCLILKPQIVEVIGSEDDLVEWLTALGLLAASILFAMSYSSTKNVFFILFAVLFFVGFGEEISWGQRLLGIPTPEIFKKYNVQGELTIHNLVFFNSEDMNHEYKYGIGRLLSINFLSKLFFVLYGLVLPLCVLGSKMIRSVTRYFRIPVPPASLGVFFLINWILIELLQYFILPVGRSPQYYDSVGESFEWVEAFNIAVIALFFYQNRKKIVLGEYPILD
jgi:hypothetical protein